MSLFRGFVACSVTLTGPPCIGSLVIFTGIRIPKHTYLNKTSGNRLRAKGTLDRHSRFRLERGHSAAPCRRFVLNAHFKTLMKVCQSICNGYRVHSSPLHNETIAAWLLTPSLPSYQVRKWKIFHSFFSQNTDNQTTPQESQYSNITYLKGRTLGFHSRSHG